MTLPDGTMLPSETERKQIFYWLKRISSYSAWNRMLGYYQTWANVAERSVRIAVDKGWVLKYGPDGNVSGGYPAPDRPTGYTGSAISKSDLIRIWKGLAHFEEGLRRLRQGDKRVFKYDANGEFVMGKNEYSAWGTTIYRIDIGESGIDEQHTPLWTEFKAARLSLGEASGECAPEIIESQWLGDPAPTVYGDVLRNLLLKMTFPAPLPEVPDPHDNVLIPTGKDIPCSGIWEPIDAPPVKQSLSLFTNEKSPKGPFAPAGCMNYLHADSAAPKAKQETADDIVYMDVTWRLIWRDDRYEDGSIPAEEADYVFLKPQAPEAVAADPMPASSDVLYGETGQPVPKAGRWLVDDDLDASVTLGIGDTLPEHNGRHVRWVLAEH
jgi:hypothetical protein